MKLLLIPILSLILGACASDPNRHSWGNEDYDENSKAKGAAFRVDAMQVRKPMPRRPDWKPMEFYFKHCSDLGEGNFYSKSNYDCTGPY